MSPPFKENFSSTDRRKGLLFILSLGIAIFLLHLGSTGLVDETPPLFAAAGRAMSDTGDWLTPRVNGLPRYDKPPLIYWLMALGYSIPGLEVIDPLGTWAARLPSALSSLLMMLFLGDTVMRWPQFCDDSPRRTGVLVALAFALSPLVLVWSRTAVSDALLCSTLGMSLLSHWRRYVDPFSQSWWSGWIFLGLAILTKGPVALILSFLVICSFTFFERNFTIFVRRICVLPGLLITLLISCPWYLVELIVEGKPFIRSFFGYHNFQRFISVVNSHSEPWWYFFLVMVIGSLPFTPFLLLGLYRSCCRFFAKTKRVLRPEETLMSFSACWLLSILVLFTSAVTKLPSYWLPATPAAAILIGLTVSVLDQRSKGLFWSWICVLGLSLFLSITIWLFSYKGLEIYDPEMPSFGKDLLQSGLLNRAAICVSLSVVFGIYFLRRSSSIRLLFMQFPLVAFHLVALLPIFNLGDKLRQLPLRKASQLMLSSQRPREQLAMVGVLKPSIHFYTNQIIVFEGRSESSLVNLDDRLRNENRKGWLGRPISGPSGSQTVLLIIDEGTTKRLNWKDVPREVLGGFGIYKVWRIDRTILSQRASQIKASGVEVDWNNPRPERF